MYYLLNKRKIQFSFTLILSALYFRNAIKIFSADIQYIKANRIPMILEKTKKNFINGLFINTYPKTINETENLWLSNETNKEPAVMRRTPKTKIK